MGSKKRKAAAAVSAAAVKPTGSATETAPTEEARVASLQSWLLAAGGTIHPDLRFGVSALGGTGVFATRLIAANTDLFVVPLQCIISLDTVRKSRPGRELCDAVCALDPELADEEATEIATWIFMVAGRRDPQVDARTHARASCTCPMHIHVPHAQCPMPRVRAARLPRLPGELA